MPIIFYLYRV